MSNGIEIHAEAKSNESTTALDEICLEAARKMLHRALELGVEHYVERRRDKPDANGHALVTRNGKAQPQKVTVGSGTIEVEAPRVRDRRVDEAGERCRFTSYILPPYVRRSPKVCG